MPEMLKEGSNPRSSVSTTDLQTAIGSRDKEKTGAIGIANADIFNRRGLARRKVGGAGARDANSRCQARGRSQKNPLYQAHFKFPFAKNSRGQLDSRAACNGPSLLTPPQQH